MSTLVDEPIKRSGIYLVGNKSLAQYSPKPIPRASWKLRPRQIAREMSRPVSTIQNSLGKLQASNRVANPNHGKYVVYEPADETRQSLC
jgi:hypothetical protein